MKTPYPLPLIMAAIFFCLVSCKPKSSESCMPNDKARPETPPCCSKKSEVDQRAAGKNTFIDTTSFRWLTAVRCPCDSTLIQLDSTKWDPNEETAAAQSKQRGEGNPIVRLPVSDRYDRKFHDGQKRTTGDNPPHGTHLKVAILDSGLDTAILREHRHEIHKTMNMFTFTDNVSDSVGHGTAIFAIVDGHAQNRATYYIYKCINNDGFATTFSIACALKCALKDGVQVINMSLGSYLDDPILRNIIEADLKDVAIITSHGNDCTIAEEKPHFPSEYMRAFGIVGIDANWFEKSAPGAPLWGCTNGSKTHVNLAAASTIKSTDGRESHGTSFAAAYVTGRFIVYLFDNRKPNPHAVFRDKFLNDTSVIRTDEHYLHAANTCVNIKVIR